MPLQGSGDCLQKVIAPVQFPVKPFNSYFSHLWAQSRLFFVALRSFLQQLAKLCFFTSQRPVYRRSFIVAYYFLKPYKS